MTKQAKRPARATGAALTTATLTLILGSAAFAASPQASPATADGTAGNETAPPAAEGAGAAKATISISSPSSGATVTGGRVTVRGTYASTRKVTGVRLVACRASGQECKAYLIGSTNGAFAQRWRSIPTLMTPTSGDGKRGRFSVILTGMPTTKLRLSAYVIDGSGSGDTSRDVDINVQQPSNQSYISVLFGRANWKAVGGENCVNQPAGARTLEQNAADMAARGLTGVAQVVTSRIAETQHLCQGNFTLEASWRDLARLRDFYGWSVTSQSKTYPDLTTQPEGSVIDESLATLPIFKAHGHYRAWGSFAYPNNRQDARVQGIVTRYFAFGRVYGFDMNTKQSATQFPYPMKTLSVNGGRCHNEALPCYEAEITNNRRTTPPQVVARALKPGYDKWGVVQFYRIVDGTEGKLGDTLAWNCAAPDWRDRWTSQPELYCRDTFLMALDLRNKSAQSVDPAEVGLAWGRTPW